MALDLSSLTDAQLTTMRDNLVTAINNLITGEVQMSSAPDGGSWTNFSLDQMTALLSAVSSEIATRDDSVGGITAGMIQVEIGEAP